MHVFTSLQPTQLGTLALKNRLIFPPMQTDYAQENGEVNDRVMQYYEARAKGGVGLVTVEGAYIHPSGRGFAHGLGVHDDAMIPGLRKLVHAIHKHGAKASLQLFHGGRQASPDLSGGEVVAASHMTTSRGNVFARELTVAEIGMLVKAHGDAARRAVEAGFDCIDLHGAHGYLISGFLSPFSNTRTDAYGGSRENRLRFAREIIAEVRKQIGPDVPIVMRLNSWEHRENGIDQEECVEIARTLSHEPIQAVHISASVRESGEMLIPPMAFPRAWNVESAAAVRHAVEGRVAVVAVGRIKTLEQADDIIVQGKADFVAMGRPLIADPDLPMKYAQGRPQDVTPCIACNEGCLGGLASGEGVGCALNPYAGNEYKYAPLQAPVRKKILIAGGGPAGMEAARTAALMGHDVVLYEKSLALGGQMNLACKPPHKEEIEDYIQGIVRKIHNAGVRIVMGTAVDDTVIRAEKPDCVIVATGAKPISPAIPGMETSNVYDAQSVLLGGYGRVGSLGQKVVVVGGGLIGTETAECIAAFGKGKVILVEMLDEIAREMEYHTKDMAMPRIGALPVEVLLGTKVEELAGDKVFVSNASGRTCLESVSAVVMAVGTKSDTDLHNMLDRAEIAHVTVGDCQRVGKILNAVHGGFLAARNI